MAPCIRHSNSVALMRLLGDLKRTIHPGVGQDAAFCISRLAEDAETLLVGDVSAAKAILRDSINTTVGFEKVAGITGTTSKTCVCRGRAAIQARVIAQRSSNTWSAIPGAICGLGQWRRARPGGCYHVWSDHHVCPIR
jgi:hypothetical protein